MEDVVEEEEAPAAAEEDAQGEHVTPAEEAKRKKQIKKRARAMIDDAAEDADEADAAADAAAEQEDEDDNDGFVVPDGEGEEEVEEEAAAASSHEDNAEGEEIDNGTSASSSSSSGDERARRDARRGVTAKPSATEEEEPVDATDDEEEGEEEEEKVPATPPPKRKAVASPATAKPVKAVPAAPKLIKVVAKTLAKPQAPAPAAAKAPVPKAKPVAAAAAAAPKPNGTKPSSAPKPAATVAKPVPAPKPVATPKPMAKPAPKKAPAAATPPAKQAKPAVAPKPVPKSEPKKVTPVAKPAVPAPKPVPAAKPSSSSSKPAKEAKPAAAAAPKKETKSAPKPSKPAPKKATTPPPAKKAKTVKKTPPPPPPTAEDAEMEGAEEEEHDDSSKKSKPKKGKAETVSVAGFQQEKASAATNLAACAKRVFFQRAGKCSLAAPSETGNVEMYLAFTDEGWNYVTATGNTRPGSDHPFLNLRNYMLEPTPVLSTNNEFVNCLSAAAAHARQKNKNVLFPPLAAAFRTVTSQDEKGEKASELLPSGGWDSVSMPALNSKAKNAADKRCPLIGYVYLSEGKWLGRHDGAIPAGLMADEEHFVTQQCLEGGHIYRVPSDGFQLSLSKENEKDDEPANGFFLFGVFPERMPVPEMCMFEGRVLELETALDNPIDFGGVEVVSDDVDGEGGDDDSEEEEEDVNDLPVPLSQLPPLHPPTPIKTTGPTQEDEDAAREMEIESPPVVGPETLAEEKRAEPADGDEEEEDEEENDDEDDTPAKSQPTPMPQPELVTVLPSTAPAPVALPDTAIVVVAPRPDPLPPMQVPTPEQIQACFEGLEQHKLEQQQKQDRLQQQQAMSAPAPAPVPTPVVETLPPVAAESAAANLITDAEQRRTSAADIVTDVATEYPITMERRTPTVVTVDMPIADSLAAAHASLVAMLSSGKKLSSSWTQWWTLEGNGKIVHADGFAYPSSNPKLSFFYFVLSYAVGRTHHAVIINNGIKDLGAAKMLFPNAADKVTWSRVPDVLGADGKPDLSAAPMRNYLLGVLRGWDATH